MKKININMNAYTKEESERLDLCMSLFYSSISNEVVKLFLLKEEIKRRRKETDEKEDTENIVAISN